MHCQWYGQDESGRRGAPIATSGARRAGSIRLGELTARLHTKPTAGSPANAMGRTIPVRQDVIPASFSPQRRPPPAEAGQAAPQPPGRRPRQPPQEFVAVMPSIVTAEGACTLHPLKLTASPDCRTCSPGHSGARDVVGPSPAGPRGIAGPIVHGNTQGSRQRSTALRRPHRRSVHEDHGSDQVGDP